MNQLRDDHHYIGCHTFCDFLFGGVPPDFFLMSNGCLGSIKFGTN